MLSTVVPSLRAQQTEAQQPPVRLHGEVDNSQMVPIPGSLHPLARPANDAGRLPQGTQLRNIHLFFSRTAAQDADLKQLIKDQQDPSTPLYHHWLTPEQYGARFGLADSDIAKVQQWLEQQGFSVDSVARGKSFIAFSGTAGQVEQAFSTQMHRYNVVWRGQTESHFAPSTALSVPAALAPVVLGVRDLDDFRPHSMMRHLGPQALAAQSQTPHLGAVQPAFTSGQTGNHFLAPGDIDVIYDVNALSKQGITGVGQTIAVMGQSAIVLSDIEAFQTAAGLTVKDPTETLVPNTGTATVVSGDEGESDLDLEWSGAMAPGATIEFVYTGNSQNNGVFDSTIYAVDNKIGQIISLSYGACEFDAGTYYQTFEITTSQAATQGQTILAAAGDSGSTSCYSSTSTDTLAQQEQLNVNYPASSQYVTGVGGTEFNEGTASGATQYWSANGTNDVITSALSYMPEVVWNDDSAGYIAAGGGGVSTIFTKPTWQTGVPGIPGDGHRDVPDLSLDSSNNHDPYLLCTSDQSNWDTQVNPPQASSCTNGFRDSTTGLLTVAGGTSFATPIVAGMLADINQKVNATSGQGLINPTLYQLAANSTTYASAFHDTIVGGNNCQVAGSSVCSGNAMTEYMSGTGYDLASGLGSIDLNSLAMAWPTTTGSTLIGTTTTITPSTVTPSVGQTVTFTIGVSSSTGSSIPTGTVSISVDSVAQTPTLTLSNGAATYQTSFITPGAHTVEASYSGDSTHATSNATASVNASVVSSGVGTFTMTASNITVVDGNRGFSTITITPAGGYSGNVLLNITPTGANANALASSACFQTTAIAVGATGSATGSFSVDTSAQNCINTNGQSRGKHGVSAVKPSTQQSSNNGNGRAPIAAATMLGGLLLAGFLGRKSRKLRGLAMVALLVSFGWALSGCGSSRGGGGYGYGGYGYGYGGTASNPPTGTYTLSVTGTDSKTSSITYTTTATLQINP
uniref:Putative Peptidase S8 and S53, subtilisin,kexin, sedolisin n=1 Tax=mine drainage metagenome TaxID=410659 RepID=E6PZA4_9ZZZZ